MPVEYRKLPFQPAIDFLLAKTKVPTATWKDVWKEQHDTAFMVAGAMKADLLNDLFKAIEKAITEGTTLETFRKDFDEIVKKHGWQYKGGPAWRTRVIYETNVRQAYNAGRERQMLDPDLRKHRPYGVYKHGDSAHPRALHLKWHDTVLPLDDPWWDTHTPQNGWGCTCKKFSLSDAEMQSRGLKVTPRPDDGTYEWINTATGEVHTIPAGIDPGFDYAPGRTGTNRRLRASMRRKAEALPKPLREQLKADIEKTEPKALWPKGIDPVFSTVKGVTRTALENVLREIPDQASVDKLARFVQAHPVQALFIKQTEMSSGSKTAWKISDAVREFLGLDNKYQAHAYHTHRRPSRVGGFTSDVFNHVVVKAKSTATVAKVDAAAMAEHVNVAIHARINNKGPLLARGVDGGEPVSLHWGFTSAIDLANEGKGDAALVSTFLHEMGHQVHYYAGAPGAPIADTVTMYARTNKFEWHAEHFVGYMLNRQAMNEWWPDAVKYFDDLIDRATESATKSR